MCVFCYTAEAVESADLCPRAKEVFGYPDWEDFALSW